MRLTKIFPSLVYVNCCAKIFILAVTASAYLGATGCAEKTDEPATQMTPANDAFLPASENPSDADSEQLDALWAIGREQLSQVIRKATTLHTLVEAMLADPNQKKLSEAQLAWRDLAAAYEAFAVITRLYQISNTEKDWLFHHNYQIAAWPIEQGFLDSYGPYPFSGIINDVGIPITELALRGMHGQTDMSDVSLGIYAIEFLLFGEKNLRGHLAFKPTTIISDAAKKRGFKTVEEIPRNRRIQLLKLQTSILVEDLKAFLTFWESGHGDRYTLAGNELTLNTFLIQALLLEQATAIKQHVENATPTDAENQIWKDHQLARRLQHQAQGLANVSETLRPENKKLIQLLKQLAATYEGKTRSNPLQSAAANWQDLSAIMQAIAAELEASTAQKVTP